MVNWRQFETIKPLPLQWVYWENGLWTHYFQQQQQQQQQWRRILISLARWFRLFVCLFFRLLLRLLLLPKHPNIEGYKSKNRMNVKVEMNACHHKKCEHIEPSVPSQTEIIRSLSHVSSVFHFHRCFSCRWISMAVKLADRDRYHGSNGKKKRKI